MTIQDLETALKVPEGWKRSEAFSEFSQTEFGVEALPVLKKALDDEFISVVLAAIECIGKLGPRALIGEPTEIKSPCGLVAKLLSIGNRVWSYSGYKNAYGTSLDTLVKLGFKNEFLFEYVRENIELENPSAFIRSLTALLAIGSPEAISFLKNAAVSHLPKLNKAHAKKVLAILAKVEPSLKIERPQDWYPFHTLEVQTGRLWVGDPHLPNADDGCIVKVAPGRYVVECDGMLPQCSGVSKMRVRLEGAKRPRRGKKLGEAGTDSAMLGICEIDAFEAAYKKEGGADRVQEAIDLQTKDGFGVLAVRQFPNAIMPFVPIGSDGNGPVFALMSGTQCVGIELPFTDEDDEA
jgi:hypothetical protein